MGFNTRNNLAVDARPPAEQLGESRARYTVDGRSAATSWILVLPFLLALPAAATGFAWKLAHLPGHLPGWSILVVSILLLAALPAWWWLVRNVLFFLRPSAELHRGGLRYDDGRRSRTWLWRDIRRIVVERVETSTRSSTAIEPSFALELCSGEVAPLSPSLTIGTDLGERLCGILPRTRRLHSPGGSI